MEDFLHHLWKNRLYTNSCPMTVTGEVLEVLDPGRVNPHAGPDFFNAKIKLNGTLWVGNVEIHQQASHWFAHHHHLDAAYDSVVLHVVATCDRMITRSNGQPIPHFVLQYTNEHLNRYQQLKSSKIQASACQQVIPSLSSIVLMDFKTTLGIERIQQKATTFLSLLEYYQGAWEEVFYITLARSLGKGLNSDAFERLARSLPMSCWLKHRHSLLQLEALFLGQAGFLDQLTIEDPYYLVLQREYQFLARKFSLTPLPLEVWKSFRIRPSSFPTLRVAYLATLLHTHDRLFSSFYHATSMQDLRQLLDVDLSAFWDTHYHFEQASKSCVKHVGRELLQTILINAYLPLLYARALYYKDTTLAEEVISQLEALPAENNQIVRQWRQAGMPVSNAFDSQALVQLHRQYCEPRKCIYCRLGHYYLKQKNNRAISSL